MSIQLIIIILYILATVAIGVWSMRKATGADAFHGIGMGVMACVAAGTGEWLGGTSTIGVSSYGYSAGISGAWYTMANSIGVMFLALFFAKMYRSLEQITVPGLIEQFIGVKPRVVASIILSFVMVVVGGAQIIAAGSLGVTVLGLDYNIACIVLGIAFIIYTLAGGMNAVAATNTMHLFVMYGGVILALFLVKADLGGSYQSLSVALPAVPYFSWFGIGVPKVTSWIIASILGACTAQAGIQPILAAKDVDTAKRAAIITACVVAPFGICTAFLGMCAKAKFPALASAKLALPTLMMDMNPIAGGLVLASVCAAILSTVSPIILASGTMITKDIYHRVLRPEATDSQVFRFSRIATGISGLICIAIAMIPNIRILDMVYFAYTLRGSIFVIILFGIYYKATSNRGAVWAMIATALVGMGWVAYKAHFHHFPIHPAFTETYAAVLVATVLTPLLSNILKDEPEDVKKE